MPVISVVPVPYRTIIKSGQFALPDSGSIMRSVKKVIDSSIIGEETYTLEVMQDGITVSASTNCGLFRGWQTLKQLVCTSKDNKIPYMRIEDRPRFAYRGFMIDSCRHMQSIDELKRMIDAAAMFKFNVFHWHLSDDQGFRFECDKYPLLTSIGAYRSSCDLSRNDGEVYGGFYTKADMTEIVRYCAERYIEVIPEIEMPGHTTAMISSYPQLSCKDIWIPLRTTAGIFPEILCAGKKETYDFIYGLLDEVLEIFPSRLIHIGGDEAPKQEWKACPHCKELMKNEGLFDTEQLQGYFTKQIASYLQSQGRQAICWNESLKSGMFDGDIIAELWMDKDGDSVNYANKGGNIIVSDFFHYYCDYPYAMTSLNKTYNFEPVVEGLTKEGAANVMGVCAKMWTEYISDAERMNHLAFPRFAAIAESAWSLPQIKDKGDFAHRFNNITPMLRKIGINPAPSKDWNPDLLTKLTDNVKFFASNITKDSILSLINSKKDD